MSRKSWVFHIRPYRACFRAFSTCGSVFHAAHNPRYCHRNICPPARARQGQGQADNHPAALIPAASHDGDDEALVLGQFGCRPGPIRLIAKAFCHGAYRISQPID